MANLHFSIEVNWAFDMGPERFGLAPAAAEGVPAPGGRVVRIGPREGLGPGRCGLEEPGKGEERPASIAWRGLLLSRSAGRLGWGPGRSSNPKDPLPGPQDT